MTSLVWKRARQVVNAINLASFVVVVSSSVAMACVPLFMSFHNLFKCLVTKWLVCRVLDVWALASRAGTKWIHCDDFAIDGDMSQCHSKVSKRPSTKVSLSWFIAFLIYLKLAAETGHLFEYFVNRRQHVIKMYQKGRVSSRLDSSHWERLPSL
jgi:hypothetical protein